MSWPYSKAAIPRSRTSTLPSARITITSASARRSTAMRFITGPKMMSTELMEISETVNKSYLNLHFDYKYDDIKHPDNFFFRSDHYNYARKGIPIIFYMDGEHEDYHRPSDTADKIDYQNMEKVTRTVYATGWELANRANRPRVDKVPTQGAGN